MPHKQLLFHSAAREKVLRGAQILADAVRITLGPKSRCVLIQKPWGEPIVCNDGVTIAKEIDLADAEENLGARMMREAAERTGQEVGDGTTTSTLLAQAIFAEGLRNVAAGASAIDLKRGLDRGVKLVVDALRAQSRPLSTHRERVQVATVSGHNDPAIGELVAQAIEKVGAEGAISVEEAKGTQTTVETVEGLQFDRGWLSPYFVTDAARLEAVLDEPYLVIHDRAIATLKDLLPLLEQIAAAHRSALFVAEEVEGEALATLAVNRLRGALACAAVKAPGFGDARKAMLEDLAVITGGQVISAEAGLTLEHATLAQFGQASRAVVGRETTTVIGGRGDKAAIAERIASLKQQAERAASEYDREKLEQRTSRLTGGVAVVRVGAASEAELKSRKEAFDDSINATRAAVAEGIIPGAGLALLRAIAKVEAEAAKVEGDERTGLKLLAHALSVPTRQIAENSGADGGVVADRMLAGKDSFGFDAATGQYVDLYEAGIIDPTKVVRVAVENAVSVASVLLLTEATLTELPEPKEQPQPGLGEA